MKLCLRHWRDKGKISKTGVKFVKEKVPTAPDDNGATDDGQDVGWEIGGAPRARRGPGVGPTTLTARGRQIRAPPPAHALGLASRLLLKQVPPFGTSLAN